MLLEDRRAKRGEAEWTIVPSLCIPSEATMNPAKLCIFPTMLLAIAVLLCTTGYAGGRDAKAKSKSLKPLPPGPEWVDTNHDGRLSDEELKRAMQILNDKIKKAEIETTKTAKK